MLTVIRWLDAVGAWSGRLVQWLILPLMGALGYEVVARYFFHAPTLWAYDITYMLYGSHFMLGAAAALLYKDHIRTDLFYARWPVRRQALVDATLYLLFFFPGMGLFLVASAEAAVHSWSIREASEASAWRPIIYPFRTAMPVAGLLLLLQGASEFLKCVQALRTGVWP